MLEKRLSFDEVLINLQGGKPFWYSSVISTGQTPAILTEDGKAVYESSVILEFLDEKFPERWFTDVLMHPWLHCLP